MAAAATHQSTRPYSPLNADEPVSSNGCGCFRLFGFNRSSNFEDGNLLQQQQQIREDESWMARKLKKLKEVSEMAAGPKWKNFIRKIGGYLKGGRKQRNHRFQYDAVSYALNFDEEDDDDDDDLPPNGFSTRFAVPNLAAREQHSIN